MRYLKYFSIAVLVCFMLCVSAFAFDSCSHISSISDVGVSDNLVCVYDDNGHYIYCIEDNCLVSFFDILGSNFSHSDNCYVAIPEFPYSFYERGVLSCPSFSTFYSGNFDSNIGVCFDDTAHYFYCTDCGAYAEVSFLLDGDVPHADSDCVICSAVSAEGIPILGVLPIQSSGLSGVIKSTTDVFSSVIQMTAASADVVIHTPLLLFAFVSSFLCVGFLLFKRLSR